jgi:hypothetical protein
VLALQQAGSGRLAGADGQHGPGAGSLEDQFELVGRGRQVDVAEAGVLGGRRLEPGLHRAALPPVWAAQQLRRQVWLAGQERLHHLGRAVGAAVVDDQQLAVDREAADEAGQLLRPLGEALLLVVDGDHEGEGGPVVHGQILFVGRTYSAAL